MKHHASDAHTLAAASALGALDPDERKYFNAHLQACEACRQEAAEFEATAARLAAAVAQPPHASAKPQVMAAIDGVRQLPPRVASAASALGDILRRRALPLALAAGVAAAAAALGGVALWQAENRQDLKQQAHQALQQLDEVSTVLAAPDARTVHGRAIAVHAMPWRRRSCSTSRAALAPEASAPWVEPVAR
ncbi:zf-HC2 domain-containing protein [Streptomyces spororaveus]|nr:zf-HC2 domain-containing protein [Streptomyces spororaveus]